MASILGSPSSDCASSPWLRSFFPALKIGAFSVCTTAIPGENASDHFPPFDAVNASGAVVEDANPNGSIESIAGICSEERNVVGLMPHPERATGELLGSTDGLVLLRSLLDPAA